MSFSFFIKLLNEFNLSITSEGIFPTIVKFALEGKNLIACKSIIPLYTLFEDEESDQYNLRFEHAICFYGKAKEQLYLIIEGSLPECDLIFADRNNSINKKVVYGKSGKVYQNRG